MKKTLSLLLSALLVLAVFTACDTGKGETHTHTFAEDWSWDENDHWHVATCEHTDEISDKAAHVDANGDDICDVCSYAKDHTHTYDTTVWKWDSETHYHAGTCGHEVKQDVSVHADENNDGLCDVCGYDYGHTHTYADTWTFDKDNHWHAPSCGHTVANADTAAHVDEDNDGLCDVCGYDYDHTHTYAEAWESDDVYHWHKASCGHEVISTKVQHRDDNKDGYCDDCNYQTGEIITYTATIGGSEFVTFVSSTTVTVNAGAEVTFTFTAPIMVVIDSVENAELVGEPIEANGVKTYTVKIAALRANTTVTVAAHRSSNATVIVPDGKVTFVADRIGYVEQSVQVEIPEPGHYIIYSPDHSDIEFDLAGNTLEQNGMTISYEFDVAEAGTITIVLKYFAWGEETVEATYVVTKVENTNTLNTLEGSGYELPTNADVTVSFKVPSAGLWQITSSVPVRYNNDETTPFIFKIEEGKLEYTVVLHYSTTEASVVTFDWKISLVGGEPQAVTKGENSVLAPYNDYTAITFTPDTTGSYRFTTSSEAIYLYEWVEDEDFGFSYMSGLGSNYIPETLQAGKTYTFYVSIYVYAEEKLTEDTLTTLTIDYLGYVPDMSYGGENTQTGSALVGTSNSFVNEYGDESEYEITVSNGQISLDGGATWNTTASVTLNDGEILSYMVKGNDDTATMVTVSFRHIVYEGSLSIGGDNTLTLIPGKNYELTLSGSSAGYYGEYLLVWDNADVIVIYKGKTMTSPATIDMYNSYYSSLVVINRGSSTVTVPFTLTDPADDGDEGDDGDQSTGTELQLGRTNVISVAFLGETAVTFTATEAGTYTISFADGETNGIIGHMIEGTTTTEAWTAPYTVELGAGESLNFYVWTISGFADTIDIIVTKA